MSATEKKIELTLFRGGGPITLAIYVGIGALLHAFVIGPQFDWSSAWTWGWLLGWPIALFIAFWGVILIIGAAILLVVGLMMGFEKYREHRSQKELREMIKKQRERASSGR